MSDYRTVARIVKNKIELYEFDGCRDCVMWNWTELFCTKKSDVWVEDKNKLKKSCKINGKEMVMEQYNQWLNDLTKYKIED